jgi:hypothetical protein
LASLTEDLVVSRLTLVAAPRLAAALLLGLSVQLLGLSVQLLPLATLLDLKRGLSPALVGLLLEMELQVVQLLVYLLLLARLLDR